MAHHLLLLRELDAVAKGRVDRLMVLMPPGSAKSTYTSVVFPAWWLTIHPRSSIIAASHTADLAEHFSRLARDLVNEQGNDIGLTVLTGDRSRERWQTSFGGRYAAVGLRGAVTGRRADLILIDDPIKSQHEADSAHIRNQTWDWFRFDLITRLTPRGRIVLIMTRWHEEDLGGRLLGQSDADWRVLRLPALAEEEDPLGRSVGTALWPEWEDSTALLRRRLAVGERAWWALYQQSPRPLEGSLFKVAVIDIIESAPTVEPLSAVRAWDFAATTKTEDNDPDWTVGLKLHRTNDGHFIVLDVIRVRASPYKVEQLLLDTARTDGRDVLISLPQDPGSAGKSVASQFVRKLAGHHAEATLETGEKSLRASAVAAQVEAGNVSIVRAAWNAHFLEELREFPHGRKDDQVDALSRAFWRLLRARTESRYVATNLLTR
ncbi:MAG: phage terminase large subunit [Proteobacteria bacterium]|nr:phage terminase large subunit [Pseudomonadota bacterium]